MTPSSPWEPGTGKAQFPTLDSTLEVDVAIIGGGIAGLTTAYELTKAGKKVALLEQGRIAEGASGWTTAFVTYVTDAPFLAQAWEAGRDAIDELERIIKTEKIDCNFMRCPAYIFAEDEPALTKLHQIEELARAAGFKVQIDDATLGFANPGYLRVERQAKFHPVKFLTVLAERTAALGAQVFENSKVLSYSGSDPCIVKTEHGEIHAKQIVLATHMPNGDPDLLSVRITAYQTYCLEAEIPSGVIPEALYWDTHTPYHYFRVDKFEGHDRLILGGEDHKTGQNHDPKTQFGRLEEFLQKLLPGVKYKIIRQWSGEILEPIDGMPFIGQSQKNKRYFMATGFSGNGMTFGVQSGMLLRDLIMGKTNPYTKLFCTLRFGGLMHLFERGYNFVTQAIKGRLAQSGATMNGIKPGSGAIMDIDGQKIAVFKTPSGKIIKLSPVCTHLKCIVQWNDEAKTWDCPCHGSRFCKDGKVLNGPAAKPLEKLD
jgi:glycine/D-amino acid oxidase-like deaminating enzyme/nitrite reductase/ring-hydroxylating ferredoxin subunit